MDKALAWMEQKRAQGVTYSMANRNGPNSYDCSSAVYYALIDGGLLPSMRIGNTDSLFNDLERNGWTQLQPDANGNFPTQRGDVFIWGVRGASGGALGHTGIFINANDIIHCNSYYNGIYVNNYDWLAQVNGWPTVAFYRYTGASYAPPSIPGSPTDQLLDIGSLIKFGHTYRVDDLQLIGGVWQVRTNVLCKDGFTWDDNGIPAGPLVEVDGDGYASLDQSLDVGSLYHIPGKYRVLDLGQYGSAWLAMIEMDGLKLWVDVETATEIADSDAGTPTPGRAPVKQPQPVTAPESPKTPAAPQPTPEPQEQAVEVQPSPIQPQPQLTTQPSKPIQPKKEVTMAFTNKQVKELAINQQTVLDASSEFTPLISDVTKVRVYFITDLGIIGATFILAVVAMFNVIDGTLAIMLNAAIATAMLGIKQTFRISSKKQ